MMKRWRVAGLALVVASFLTTSPALAQTCDATVDPSCSGAVALASSSVVLTIVLPVTTVAGLVYFIVSAFARPATTPAASHAAEVYLRQNSLQLAQDLAAGSGPMVDDLASAMELKAENVAHLGKLLRAHRNELLPLADTNTLNPERAGEFIRTMASLVDRDPTLGPDFRAYMASYAAKGG